MFFSIVSRFVLAGQTDWVQFERLLEVKYVNQVA